MSDKNVSMAGPPQPPRSRFQVEKVDYVNEALDADEAGGDVQIDVQSIQASNELTHYATIYDTSNIKSLVHYTQEALPRVDHYRNVMSVHGHISRPTLDELHDGGVGAGSTEGSQEEESKEETVALVAVKFGWIQGVLVRCLLNIWGVMLFLRLSWVVGQAGIGLGCLIVIVASIVTTLSALSMSAICTNGEVRGGGTYYMISRSLGPEFGGAIGLIFALANAIAVAMYVVGFAETVQYVLNENKIIDGDINDIRIISCCTVVFVLGITLVGTEWESKAQIILLFILLTAMADFVIGSFISGGCDKANIGFTGWSLETAKNNFGPSFQTESGKGTGDKESFFSVFSVFFPAATGILAGANISGDLKDPQKAIPKGTLLAILLTTLSYILFAVIAGCCVVRTPMELSHLVNGSCNITPDPKTGFGLIQFKQVMETVSAFGPLVLAGIFAATLSSALASLISAPKVFQAVCNDKIFPRIEWFGKGFGKNNEPRRSYFLAFAIALGCCAIGTLNAIAPIISNFFLAAYCLINFACFHASFTRSPGFRPSFKYYNCWASLVGAVLCAVVMFIMNWIAGLITLAIILGLYIYIYYHKPDVNWGSSTQAKTYLDALNSVIKLNSVQDHVKNYRPQILVLTGNPSDRPPLVDFAYMLTKKLSLMICGHVKKPPLNQIKRYTSTVKAYQWLERRKVKSFYSLVEDDSFSHGVLSLIQLVGVGKLRPNVVLMGYKNNWQMCDPLELQEYFDTIHDALDAHMSLAILRLPGGLDYSMYSNIEEVSVPVTNGHGIHPTAMKRNYSVESGLARTVSHSQISQGGSCTSSPPTTPSATRAHHVIGDSKIVQDIAKDIPKDVLLSVNQFLKKQKKSFIDVWWLYDDGGLTMLIPYLLSTRSQWSACKLRIFALANKSNELDQEQRNMAALLNKFRIDYADVTVIPDIVKSPQNESKLKFKELIAKWRIPGESDGKSDTLHISESEYLAVKEKTYRHLRLYELLQQYSKEATLIVMTLPMPRKGTCSAPMYMAWLEMLTRDMPPFLLVRGNQTSVLTFYS